MANRVVIDVETRYHDGVSAQLNTVSKNADKAKKSVEGATKAVEKLGKTKADVKLTAKDEASSKLSKVLGAAKQFASKSFKATLSFTDKASSVLGSITGAARTFAGRTFSAGVKIIDYATTPLRKIKDMLFNIKSLIAAVTMGLAAKQFVLNPINLADQYTSAKIGFSTLLGESEANAMMNKIDQFAKATPFKTSNTIASIQKMMAYGWDASRVIDDMKVIGDAAAATGKGDQGLESIVYALSEIRSKGKLSTQELNQLASAGIKAKAYLAEGLGYGSDDAGMAKLAKALESGAVGANQAIELILEGMKEFDGMMDKTANETVEGLKSQLADVFEINIARKWGQGLQDGAKKGLGSIVSLLNTAEDSLEDVGDLVYDLGKEFSNWGAGKLENFVTTIKEIAATDTFKNASLGDKVKMLWNGAIGNPFSEWWDNTVIPWWDDTALPWLSEKSAKAGEAIGKGLTTGLLALFGATDEAIDGVETGASIAGSFVEGFKSGFDGSVIADAFADAFSQIWDVMPWWAKTLLLGYGAGKVAGGVNSMLTAGSNLANGAMALFGSAGAGTGILGKGALTAINLGAGNLAGGASLGAGALSAIGLGSIAGGIAGGASIIKGGLDLYKSVKAYKAGDETEGRANAESGVTTLGGVAIGASLGATIGSVVPVLGTAAGALIGAGIGGVAGWLGGNKLAKNIREEAEAAKFESEEMQEAIKDSEKSAEELALQFEKAVNKNIAAHFGDVALTMEEIASIANKVVKGEMADGLNQFTRATETAAATLKSMEESAKSLDRLNWKVGLGLKLDETEITEYRTAIDNYMASAKTYVEDKHYEFTAAVTLLMDVNDGDGKTILEGGNSFYSQLQEQINGMGSKLSETVNIALEDGVITLDEQAEIVNLQNQIAEITNKLTQAETEAKFEALKIKFGDSNISSESFAQLQEELQNQLTESSESYENALTVGLTNLRLQYNEGLINENEYENLKGALEDSFNSQMEELELKVQNVQLEIIAEAYKDVLGEDGLAKLNSAIQTSVTQGINPIDWTTDDVRRFLGVNSLSEETSAAIIGLLSNLEFETEPSVDVKPTYNLLNKWQPASSLFNSTIYPKVTVSPSYVDTKGAPYKQNANGSIINSKTLSWIGEEGPEAIIPLVPGRRARGLKLWEEAGRRLGVTYHANGGIIGGGGEPVQVGGDGGGSQKVEINMGGVTIEIKADGNKSMLQNIEDQEQAIAEKVAEIFKNVLSAQFANTPLKGGA